MSKPSLYGMVTVGNSANYTKLALLTLFKHTKFKKEDSFVLIDNDGFWTKGSEVFELPFGEVVTNIDQLNFSGNANKLISLANSQNKDLVFLSNDVVFTPGWNERLELNENTICIPSCNQTHNYGFPAVSNINEFGKQFGKLNSAAHLHGVQLQEPFETKLMPFYVFKLPQKIYTSVGLFDTNFHMGGEDVDYRLRAIGAGFDVKYTKSFLLHFNGASTWNGQENLDDVKLRNLRYTRTFIQKWGDKLAQLCLDQQEQPLLDTEQQKLASQGLWNKLIHQQLPKIVPQIEQ